MHKYLICIIKYENDKIALEKNNIMLKKLNKIPIKISGQIRSHNESCFINTNTTDRILKLHKLTIKLFLCSNKHRYNTKLFYEDL